MMFPAVFSPHFFIEGNSVHISYQVNPWHCLVYVHQYQTRGIQYEMKFQFVVLSYLAFFIFPTGLSCTSEVKNSFSLDLFNPNCFSYPAYLNNLYSSPLSSFLLPLSQYHECHRNCFTGILHSCISDILLSTESVLITYLH